MRCRGPASSMTLSLSSTGSALRSSSPHSAWYPNPRRSAVPISSTRDRAGSARLTFPSFSTYLYSSVPGRN